MSRLRGFLRALDGLVHRRRRDRELREEIRFHVEMETETNLRRGMPPAEARRAALLAFGGEERYREAARTATWTALPEAILGDLGYALRTLLRRPGFSAAVVLTLGLGMGGVSGLFGVVNGLFLRTPPGIPDGEGLVWVRAQGTPGWLSHPDLEDLARESAGTVRMAGWLGERMTLGRNTGSESVQGQLVTGSFFPTLGVVPHRGRLLDEGDDRAGAPGVVVLGHGLWTRRFGGDPEVVGGVVTLNGEPFTVAGIAPRGFRGLELEEPADLWVATASHPVTLPGSAPLLGARHLPFFRAVGRLAEGASLEAAQVRVTAAAHGVDALEPGRDEAFTARLHPLRGWLSAGGMGSMATELAAAALLTGLVLVVACGNVASLLLARALTRRREMGIRASMGAGRASLVRLLLSEAFILGVGGAVVGVILAQGVTAGIRGWAGDALAPVETGPDPATFLFALGLAALGALLFGGLPAWRASRSAVAPLVATGPAGDGPGGQVFRKGLVAVQLAVSLALLSAAGLLVERARAGARIEMPFDTERVLAVELEVGSAGYATRAAILDLYTRLVERVEAMPEVERAAGPTFAPFGRGGAIEAVELPGGESRRVSVTLLAAAPGALAALGVDATAGTFPGREVREGIPVVVGASFVDRHLRGEPALGTRIGLGERGVGEIVAVVPDLVLSTVHGGGLPQVHVPPEHAPLLRVTTLLVRAGDGGGDLLPAVAAAVKQVDPALTLVRAGTLEDRLREAHGQDRMLSALVAALGLLGLVLAGVGLYGLIAFTVAGRTREIGLRMALGARGPDVVAGLLRDGGQLAAVGLVVGVVCAAGVGTVLAAAVPGAEPSSLTSIVAAGVTLLAVSALATWVPARRAARVDPMTALRTD